ncbi:MAG TPA: NADH-quinone oxidoreductase subunit H, partial [Actinoplanes sp.]|nr:NADH-quinone oxidoreductase subunit H [Actinoplanes sp.]
TLFLGGGTLPFLQLNGWLEFVVFLAKTLIFLFIFIWLRGTLPRLRYDQFMRFGWKVLIPVNLVWILFLAGVRVANEKLDSQDRWLLIGGIAVAVLLVALVWPAGREPRRRSIEEELAARPPGSFPVPPMDLEVPPSPRARRAVAERSPASVGAATDDTPEKEV